MTKTILTIDFDIIMAPSINSYNDRVPGLTWNLLQKECTYHSLEADFSHYQRLTNFLNELLPKVKKEQAHFIDGHSTLIHFLNKSNSYYVTNIDYHHDIGYHPDKKDKPLNCGNWVQFVPNLKDYT